MAVDGPVRAGDGTAVAWQALRSIEHDAAPDAVHCDWWTPLTPEYGTRPPDPFIWTCFVEAVRANRPATMAVARSTSDHGATMNLYTADGTDTIIETHHRVTDTGRTMAVPEPSRWACRIDPTWTPKASSPFPVQCSPIPTTRNAAH